MVKDEPNKIEQRLAARSPVRFPMEVRLANSSLLSGESVDLSPRGLGCRVSSSVPPVSRVFVTPDRSAAKAKDSPVQWEGVVVRCERLDESSGAYLLGLSFVNLNLEAVYSLMDVLLEAERNRIATAPFPLPRESLLEKPLTSMDRLTNIGEMTAVLAHEIKNPLACISGTLQVLALDTAGTGERQEILRELFGQVRRIDEIIDQMVHFARPGTPRMRHVKVENVIAGALSLMTEKIREKNIGLEVCYGKGQPTVLGDENLLRQALVKIITHVVDSMGEGGTLQLHTWWKGKATLCRRQPCLGLFLPGDDEGLKIVLMSPGDRHRLAALRQGNMTVPSPKPTRVGMDLFITHRIVEQHEGGMYAVDEAEKGSVFLITLPIVREEG